MAAKDKNAKAPKAEAKSEGKKIGASAKDLGFKYGVTDLADKMGIEPASVRVALRNKGVAKNGSVYGWNSKADLEEVIGTLQTKATKSAKAEKTEKAPAKKVSKEEPKSEAKKSPAKKSGNKKAASDSETATA